LVVVVLSLPFYPSFPHPSPSQTRRRQVPGLPSPAGSGPRPYPRTPRPGPSVCPCCNDEETKHRQRKSAAIVVPQLFQHVIFVQKIGQISLHYLNGATLSMSHTPQAPCTVLPFRSHRERPTRWQGRAAAIEWVRYGLVFNASEFLVVGGPGVCLPWDERGHRLQTELAFFFFRFAITQ